MSRFELYHHHMANIIIKEATSHHQHSQDAGQSSIHHRRHVPAASCHYHPGTSPPLARSYRSSGTREPNRTARNLVHEAQRFPPPPPSNQKSQRPIDRPDRSNDRPERPIRQPAVRLLDRLLRLPGPDRLLQSERLGHPEIRRPVQFLPLHGHVVQCRLPGHVLGHPDRSGKGTPDPAPVESVRAQVAGYGVCVGAGWEGAGRHLCLEGLGGADSDEEADVGE